MGILKKKKYFGLIATVASKRFLACFDYPAHKLSREVFSKKKKNLFDFAPFHVLRTDCLRI